MEVEIANAFIIAAEEDWKKALAALEISSPGTKSAAFLILANAQGAAEAIKWLQKALLNFEELDPEGKFIFLTKCIEVSEWDLMLSCANTVEDGECSNYSPLLFAIAQANLAQAVPINLRATVVMQIPFEVREFRIGSDDQSLNYIRKARDYFDRFEIEARQLGLKRVADISSDYALWLALRDPTQKQSGLNKLQKSLRNPSHKLRRINFALQFGITLNVDEVNQEIDKQNALSGN